MNYVKFLKHHVPIMDFIDEDEIDQPERKSYSSNNENSSRIPSERTHLNELSNKLTRKVNQRFFF